MKEYADLRNKFAKSLVFTGPKTKEGMLSSLVEEELFDIGRRIYRPEAHSGATALFADFLQNYDLYKIGEEVLHEAKLYDRVTEFGKLLRGYMVERMAYNHASYLAVTPSDEDPRSIRPKFLENEDEESLLVLSPGKTKLLFKSLFPTARVSRKGAKTESLHGVYVPDGLLVRTTLDGKQEVVGMMEYTLTTNAKQAEYLTKKEINFNGLKGKTNFFDKARIVFVTSSVGGVISTHPRYRDTNISLPFNNYQFSHFYHSLTSMFPKEGLTEEEAATSA